MSEMVTIDEGLKLEGYVARPTGDVKGAVIVIHEVWGLVAQIKSVADRLAGEGYVALAPDLLSETDITAMSTPEIQESLFDPARRDAVQTKMRALMAPIQTPEFAIASAKKVQACFEWLYENPVHKQKVAIWGFCFGGSYSFKLATLEPRLALALPFYGHCDDPVEVLKKITCPVRAFYGEKDERLIASLDDLTRRMKEAGVDFEAKVYPDCGHAFFNDANRFAYNEAAAKDAWRRVVKLLSTHLG